VAGRPPSDPNDYLCSLNEFAESREAEHMRYERELEKQVETLHSLFNEIGEVAIGFHDLLVETLGHVDGRYVQEHEQDLNSLYAGYTEVVGKRNELLLNSQDIQGEKRDE
jgi:hypothetical protein